MTQKRSKEGERPLPPIDSDMVRRFEEEGAYEMAYIARGIIEQRERRARQFHRRCWRWLWTGEKR